MVPASGGYAAYSKQLAGTTLGAAQLLYTSANSVVPHGMRGAGFARAGTGSPEVDAEAVYLPTGTEVKFIDATGDVSKPAGVSITGVPAAGGTSPTGTPWLFWSDYNGQYPPPATFHKTRLYHSCSSTPSVVNSWRYSGELYSPVGRVVALDMVATAGTVAVAAEDVNGTVGFASFPNDCSTNPTGPVTWDAFSSTGSGITTQPSVALGPGDTLWKAYVDTSFATPSLVLAP